MECRRSLVVALGLMTGALGCSLTKTQPLLPSMDAVDQAQVRTERKGPPRTPKAETELAYGMFREREARHPRRSAAEQEEMLSQAQRAYQHALKIDPKNLEAAVALARLYDSRGAHDQAVAVYQKAIKVHPKVAGIWADLGMCHARHKEWDPAIRCLHKATELDPEDRQMALNLGYCLARAGHHDESLVCFRKTVGEARAHYNLARMLQHMQQTDLSRYHLQLALQKDPQLAPAQDLLAQLDQGTVAADPEVQQATQRQE